MDDPISHEQINDILSELPCNKYLVNVDLSLLPHNENLVTYLQNIKLSPNAFPEFKTYIVSYIKARPSIGVMAGRAISESVTSMSLNSFHKSGNPHGNRP